ncbi:MAG: nitroreductase family protein [Clostridia bacterium]|nr:nitroreductase family protein [Clostridia bacterium]
MEIGFGINNAVRQRTSVRTYADTPVSQETKDKILAYARTIENPFGAQVRFQWIEKQTAENGEKLGTYGFIKGANLFLGVTVEDKDGAAESVGYVFEQLVLYMTSLGLGTCWLGGTFSKSAFAQQLDIPEGWSFPILSPVGYPAKQRIKEKVFRTAINANNRVASEKLFFSDGFKTPLDLHAVGKYADCLENLRLAPSAGNKQPWRVIYDGKAFHFFKKGSMQFMQILDVGIGINHFMLTANELGLQGTLTKADVSAYPLTADMKYVASWVCENV